MPASEARIRANQASALLSTGPRTAEGKNRSCRNSLQHGLTGQGIVIPEGDAAEVERRTAALRAEMKPSGEADEVLVRRLAVASVRMDRSVEREHAAIAANVARALEEFEAPEGADEATVDRLRNQAADVALFDPSKEATLARKYEAAAERGFYRALKELQRLRREREAGSEVPTARPTPQVLGSSLHVESIASILASLPGESARIVPPAPPKPPKRVEPARVPAVRESFYVPIAIGRPG